ncbi:hypothetical protein [Mycobacterium sp. OAE908]|uniref:hypothetical protein n=1 Tax=Mycobacterium sp. OAE908 TaxID=2817899 RepID=UPI001AE29606
MNELEDGAAFRKRLELDDFRSGPSKPRERYLEITCHMRARSTDVRGALAAGQPQPQPQIDWRNVAVWGCITTVSVLEMIAPTWGLQMLIQMMVR